MLHFLLNINWLNISWVDTLKGTIILWNTSWDPQNTILDILKWMSINRLKFDLYKSVFMIFGTRKQLAKMEYNGISVADDIIQTKARVWNVGVYMVNEMEMDRHFQHVVRVFYRKLREITSFRKYLSQDSQKPWSYEASLATKSVPNSV